MSTDVESERLNIFVEGKLSDPPSKELIYMKQYSLSKNEMEQETILKPNPKRFVVFPVEYHDVWEFYKTVVASFWTVEEVDLSKDKTQWIQLKLNERHFISNIIAFLHISGGMALENLLQRFSQEVQVPEVRSFYGIQIHLETVHSEVYSLWMDTFIKNKEERTILFDAVISSSSMNLKSQWIEEWINNPKTTFAERLVTLSAIESILFSGSFAAIFWLSKRGLLPGLSSCVEFISRDEKLYRDFACLLFKHIVNKPTKARVLSIITEAVKIEQKFLSEDVPVSLIEMNCKLMCTYVEFVADRLLADLGYDMIYDSENPFDFMENLPLEKKTSFFSKHLGEYPRPGVMSQPVGEELNKFTTEAEF